LTLQETQDLARTHWANIPALEYHVQRFGTLDDMIRALENELSLPQVLAKATRTITNPQWLNGSLTSFIEQSIKAWAEFPCCSAQQLAAAIAKEMQGTNKHGGYSLHSLTEFATNQVNLNTLQRFLTDHWSQLTQMRSSRPIDQRNAPRPQSDNTQRIGLNQRSLDTQRPERQANSYNSSHDRRDRNNADRAPQRGLYSPHYPRGGQRMDTPPAPTLRAQYTPMQRDRSYQLAQHPATPSAQAPQPQRQIAPSPPPSRVLNQTQTPVSCGTPTGRGTPPSGTPNRPRPLHTPSSNRPLNVCTPAVHLAGAGAYEEAGGDQLYGDGTPEVCAIEEQGEFYNHFVEETQQDAPGVHQIIGNGPHEPETGGDDDCNNEQPQ
jgi:hypothetical protein